MDTINQRLDKWLWCARFFKSRVICQKVILTGKVRMNGTLISKSHAKIKIGDNLSFFQGKDLKEITVLSFSVFRGPAVEAQKLYQDNSIKQIRDETIKTFKGGFYRKSGLGRPTKRDRRKMDELKTIG